MELADRVFEGREYDKQLLHDYGFKPFGSAFRYETLIMDGQFIFQVTILDDRFYSDVTEVETGDIFSLYRPMHSSKDLTRAPDTYQLC